MNYLKTLLTSNDVISDIGSSIDKTANGVTGISKAINDYGMLIVIMSVFLVLFLGLMLLFFRNNAKMIDNILKKNERNEEMDQAIIQKFIESVLQKYTSGLDSSSDNISSKIVSQLSAELHKSTNQLEDDIKKYVSDEKHDNKNDYHKDIVGAYIDVNMVFKDASRTTLKKINCDRLAIYVFHNGNTSIHGLPFFKLSCIHEWTSYGGATLRGKYHTDVPLQCFNDFIEDLWRDGIYKTNDIKKTSEVDKSIAEFVACSKTQSLYMLGVKDINDKLVGFIVAEFDRKDTFDTDAARNNEILETLKEMSGKIAPIIAHHYIYKGKL